MENKKCKCRKGADTEGKYKEESVGMDGYKEEKVKGTVSGEGDMGRIFQMHGKGMARARQDHAKDL